MLEPLLIAAVGPLVAGRVYPSTADGDTPRPYAIWQRAGGTPFGYQDGSMPDKKNARVQISVWANGREKTSELMLNVERALLAPPVRAIVLTESVDLKDQETGFTGAMQDFGIWYAIA
jgi:hypothetical protein